MLRRITIVLEPATNRRLASLQTFKQGPKLKDGENDEYIGFLCDSKSAMFEGECDRVFARETVQDQSLGAGHRHCGGWRTGWGSFSGSDAPHRGAAKGLVLSRRPVVSVTSVTDISGVLDPSLYTFDAAAGILYARGPDGSTSGPWFGSTITVDYVAGYALPGDEGRTLPFDIEEAVVTLMRGAYKAKDRDPALRSQNASEIGSQSIWLGIPPDVQSVIDRYRGEYLS